MGQKVNPHGMRVGVIKDWDSRWYARADKVGDLIVEDYNIRNYLKKTLYSAGVPTIEIERDIATRYASISTAPDPASLSARAAQRSSSIRLAVEKMIGKPVAISIVEVRTPDTNAQLVAENIAQQLEKRICLPPRNEERNGPRNAYGRKGHQGHVLRPSRRTLRSQAVEQLPRGYHSSSDYPCRHRVRLCRGSHHLRPHRR